MGTSTAVKRTNKYELKREAVLGAAADLFNRRGLKGTTLADVAQAVGLVRNSITYYYPTREDLAAACLLRAIHVIGDVVGEAEVEQDVPARISKLVRRWFAVLWEIETGQRPEIANLFDARALEGERYESLLAAFTIVFRRIRGLFQAKGAPTLDGPALDARTHLLSSLLLWSRTWIGRYEAEDFDRASQHMADIVLHGLAAAKSEWRTELPDFDLPANIGDNARDQFLIVATQLMNQFGYHGASIDRISERLNVTKGAFYHHIDKKSDLVADCFERSFSIIRHAQNIAQGLHRSGWAQLLTAAALLTRLQLSEKGPLLRYTALAAVAEDARQELLLRIERTSIRYASMVSDGIIDGSVRRVDAFIAGQLIDGMSNAASDLSRWAPQMPHDHANALYTRPLLLGILCPARAD